MELPDLPLPESLLAKMAATQQNPRYHREGSVLAHTAYVVQQCLRLRDGFALDDDEKLVLYWAAVLHDIGKTVTTVWQDGRWRSPGHERAGTPMALDLLMRHPEISAANRRRILDLVHWHGFPLKFSQWQQPLDELKLLGTRTDLRLLAIFGLFDFHGRECDDKEDVMARMEHFLNVSVPQAEYELGRFPDLQAAHAGWNLRHKNAAWNAVKLRDMRLLEKLLNAPQADGVTTRGQRATLVMGAPLAGKSTWIGTHMPHAFKLELAEHGIDDALADNAYLLGRKLVEFKHLLRVYLNRHTHLVIETRPLQESVRQLIADILRDMPVTLDYVLVETQIEALRTRNLATGTPMPETALQAAYDRMELLHPWEAHAMAYVDGGR